MNAAETARAIAHSDLALAIRDPQMTGKNLLVFKRSVEIAEAELEIQNARAAAAAEARAEQARLDAEAAEIAAVAQRAAERDAAVEQAALVNAAIENARAALETLLRMPGVHPAGLEIVVLKTNRSYSATVPQSMVHDIAAAVGLPSPNDAQRKAALTSQAEAHRLGTIEIQKMATATQRGAQMREALSGPGLPQRGALLQNRGNVLN